MRGQRGHEGFRADSRPHPLRPVESVVYFGWWSGWLCARSQNTKISDFKILTMVAVRFMRGRMA